MSEVAIHIQSLGKQYRIGQKRTHKTIREAAMEWITSPVRKKPENGQAPGTFWALNEVSFDVKRGEVLGIIGRNGAGKSTLLKILSRITEPTHGRVDIFGRVGSLLEVGTGFHPELTGRENIYLNGAILGMKKSEIEAQFDRIVAFAEIEKFLDTTVKHYSSGMYTRLGFAVAAHLEPEILIVDEVLAVGDAQFQQKCMGRMGEVAREGRTVLFVSHNLSAIQTLCHRAVWLDGGRLRGQGETREITSQYLAAFADDSTTAVHQSDTCRLDRVDVTGTDQQPAGTIVSREPWGLTVDYTLFADRVAGVMARITNSDGTVLCEAHETVRGGPGKSRGSYSTHINLSEVPLAPGNYTVSIHIMVHHVAAYLIADHCKRFAVIGSLIDSHGAVAEFDIKGVLNIRPPMTTRTLTASSQE